jgi:hypothetical protein
VLSFVPTFLAKLKGFVIALPALLDEHFEVDVAPCLKARVIK